MAENGVVELPPAMPASSERLERHGIYLLDNGNDLIIWVGKLVHPDLCKSLFGADFGNIACGRVSLPQPGNEYVKRIHNVINYLSEEKLRMATILPNLYLVKEEGHDVNLKAKFLSHLIDDKMGDLWSYPLFLGFLREQMAKY